MAAPRIPITDLPEHTSPAANDLLVVQNGPITKKMQVGAIMTGSTQALDEHIADPTSAHTASAIAAFPNAAPMTGTDVQTQLAQVAALLAGIPAATDEVWVGNDPPSVSAMELWFDPDAIPIGGEGGGSEGITTEDAVDAVAAALVAGNNIDVTYDDVANTITVDVEPLTKADVGLGNVDNTADASKPVSTAQQTALDAKADKTTAINTTAPLTGGGTLAATRTLDISVFTASVKGAVPPPTTATGKFLKDDGTWATAGGAATTAQTIETVAGTTYTAVTADANKIKWMAATATVTLPSAGPALGERVDFVCVGGPATFTLGGGATWAVNPTPSAVARAVGSVVTAVKMTATAWILTGDLA